MIKTPMNSNDGLAPGEPPGGGIAGAARDPLDPKPVPPVKFPAELDAEKKGLE